MKGSETENDSGGESRIFSDVVFQKENSKFWSTCFNCLRSTILIFRALPNQKIFKKKQVKVGFYQKSCF